MAKFEYTEGCIFLVPLRNGGFARGVVARCDHRGLVFGYFFGPRLSSISTKLDEDEFSRANSILIGQFADIGLRKGEWPVIAKIAKWERKSWPMPLFVSSAERDDQVTLTEYDEESLNTKNVTVRPRFELDIDAFPVDRVMGYRSVEKRLTELLDANQ